MGKARSAFAQGTDLVEFRLDLLRSPSFNDAKAALTGFSECSVITIRPRAEGGGFRGRESERVAFIHALAELKPAFIDIELATIEKDPELQSKKLARNIIVSWHDWTGTPSRGRLRSLMTRAAAYGIPKIVATAKAPEDNLAILSLYDGRGQPPIAFCMGEKGVLSRVMAIEKGSPISYASLPGEQTAPGQLLLGEAVAVRRRLM